MLYYENMSSLRNIKNLIIVTALAIFLLYNYSFAEGPGEIEVQRITVVGDSYAGHFSLNEGMDKYDYYIFPVVFYLIFSYYMIFISK